MWTQLLDYLPPTVRPIAPYALSTVGLAVLLLVGKYPLSWFGRLVRGLGGLLQGLKKAKKGVDDLGGTAAGAGIPMLVGPDASRRVDAPTRDRERLPTHAEWQIVVDELRGAYERDVALRQQIEDLKRIAFVDGSGPKSDLHARLDQLAARVAAGRIACTAIADRLTALRAAIEDVGEAGAQVRKMLLGEHSLAPVLSSVPSDPPACELEKQSCEPAPETPT